MWRPRWINKVYVKLRSFEWRMIVMRNVYVKVSRRKTQIQNKLRKELFC